MKRAAAILGVLLAAGLGHAGRKITTNATINTTSGTAWGSLGSARSSADTTQYIGCYTTLTTTTSHAGCVAVNAVGTYRSCYTYDANLIAAIRTLTPDAYIEFAWETEGSPFCKSIFVRAMSYDEPRVP